jgi:hypothetical protein
MWKPIIIKFFFEDGGTPVLVKQFGTEEAPYSLRKYFEKQFEQSTGNLKMLMKSVLDYGANAQIYFKDRYDTDYDGSDDTKLVNNTINPSNTIDADKPTNVASKSGEIAEVARIGAALKLEGEIQISVKIQANSLEGLKFSVPVGYKYTVDKNPSGGVYSVYVTGIKSNMLGKDMKFTVTGTKDGQPAQLVYTYSPFTYAAKYGWTKAEEDATLAKLCQAIVEYGTAAHNYFG